MNQLYKGWSNFKKQHIIDAAGNVLCDEEVHKMCVQYKRCRGNCTNVDDESALKNCRRITAARATAVFEEWV